MIFLHKLLLGYGHKVHSTRYPGRATWRRRVFGRVGMQRLWDVTSGASAEQQYWQHRGINETPEPTAGSSDWFSFSKGTRAAPQAGSSCIWAAPKAGRSVIWAAPRPAAAVNPALAVTCRRPPRPTTPYLGGPQAGSSLVWAAPRPAAAAAPASGRRPAAAATTASAAGGAGRPQRAAVVP